MSYGVARRTREIGIRVALGASSRRILGLVLRQGAVLGLAGVGVGLAGALGLARFMRSLLFGIAPTDWLTFVATPAVLVVVALAASYLPARHAARVDPTVTLRCE